MRWTVITCLLLAGCDLLVPGSGDPDPNDGVGTDDPPDCEEQAWYEDADRDTFGNAERVVWACDAPTGTSARAGDCDDRDAAIQPDAGELCDGIDQDCDGLVDEDALDPTEFFADADGDGFGEASLGLSCDPPVGAASQGGDCDDGDADVYPGAMEPVCSLRDLNCDGKAGRAAVQGGVVFDTIQQAIDAAPDRAQILVCPGSRVESLSITRGVRLMGTTTDPADTQITAPPGKRVLSGTGGSVRLRGLTFAGQGRVDVADGGLVSLQSNILEIEDCRLEGGGASARGGAIWWQGLSSDGGTGASLTMERVVVANNASGTHGGALYLRPEFGGGVRFDQVTFQGNVAARNGGAVFVEEVARSAVTWSDSHASGNEAALGGALFTTSVGAGSATTILASSSTDDVGGAFVSGRSVVLDDVVIDGATGGSAVRAPRIT
ncbi:MAG: MopE-related protein, partial [Myxococcota bacterium]